MAIPSITSCHLALVGLPCLHYTQKHASICKTMQLKCRKMPESLRLPPCATLESVMTILCWAVLTSCSHPAAILQPTMSSIDLYWKCQTRAEMLCLQQTNSLASDVKQCRTPTVSAAQRCSTILQTHGRVIRLFPSPAHRPAPTILCCRCTHI